MKRFVLILAGVLIVGGVVGFVHHRSVEAAEEADRQRMADFQREQARLVAESDKFTKDAVQGLQNDTRRIQDKTALINAGDTVDEANRAVDRK